MNIFETTDGIAMLITHDGKVIGVNVGTGWHVTCHAAEFYLQNSQPASDYPAVRAHVPQEGLMKALCVEA